MDDQKNIQWILGGIDNSPEKKFFLKLVPKRKSDTLLNIFEEKIKKETLLITDGYPSYPSAVSRFGSDHVVVNHTEGFVTRRGFHTDSIENLWSHLKKDYRERSGIQKSRINIFLREFEWKKKNLKTKKPEFMLNAFCILIDSLKIIK